MVKDYVVQTIDGFIMQKPQPSIRRRGVGQELAACMLS